MAARGWPLLPMLLRSRSRASPRKSQRIPRHSSMGKLDDRYTRKGHTGRALIRPDQLGHASDSDSLAKVCESLEKLKDWKNFCEQTGAQDSDGNHMADEAQTTFSKAAATKARSLLVDPILRSSPLATW